MKKLLTACCFLLAHTFVFGQNLNEEYDAALAAKLKGNDNGMKSYVFVILKTGTHNPTDKAERDSVFAGHMRNMGRLADEGKLVMAGPFGKNDLNYRGIFIMNTDSVGQAREWVNTDPGVQAKVFDVELLPFYGSAAIQETLNIHKKISKYKD